MMRVGPTPGEWIDRSRSLEFSFEGRRYTAFAGDTVTSALAAAGVHLLGRSFKYHRPRGLLSLANHDVNALMQNGPQPNLRADVTPVEDGAAYTAVNTWGGLEHDRARWLDRLGGFLPVGFYYKAFHRPAQLFPFWERVFRRSTGLGTVDLTRTEHPSTPKRHDGCDVAVVGGGPSGLAAALAAADAGAQVALIDENARLGGSGAYTGLADGERQRRLLQLIRSAEQHLRIRIYTGSTAAGWYADHGLPLVQAGRIVKLRARATVIASGAAEQPAVFRNNDLPGVMLASAAQRLLARYGVLAGQRAVVLAANTDAYRAAVDLHQHGMQVLQIVDLRPGGEPGPALQQALDLQIPVSTGHAVVEAHARAGRLAAVSVVALGADGQPQARAAAPRLDCDLLLMSVGWAPQSQLLHQAGMRARFDEALQQFVPQQQPPGVHACGRVNGVHELALKLEDGRRAGRAAARDVGFAAAEPGPVPRDSSQPSHPYPIFAHRRGRNFIDFDEDLQLKDLENAVQEGFDSIELLKRYSTVGMGPSQGKHSNMNAIRVLARLRGLSPGEVGSTTARPLYHPVPMGHLAGRSFAPVRRTPLDSRHQQAGAWLMPAGAWRRPEFYAQPGVSRGDCILDEVRTVRSAVGLIDVGTLGKLEVRGPGALSLLDRAYTGRFATLKVGMSRYGLMLDEAGTIIDDGVIGRIAEDHFYVTATTSAAAIVYRELQRYAQVWGLEVGLANLSGHLGAINLAGPDARRVLANLTDLDLSAAAFPFLGLRLGQVAAVDCRILRVGFVGELGYEIHAGYDGVGRIWDALLAAGQPYGIRPFGVEAQRLLRLEKGHLIIGQDTDALSNPLEAGLGWALGKDKPFYVGQRSLKAIAGRPLRQRMAGFELDRPWPEPLPQECQLVIDGGEIAGRVTSIAYSPTLSKVIGLAMLTPRLAAVGSAFSIRCGDGQLAAARVVPTPFYDAEGLRQREGETP